MGGENMSLGEKRRTSDFDRLVSGLKGGDAEARKVLSREFGTLLRRFFILRGLGVPDAEDLAVDCTSDIVMRIDRFENRGKGSFVGWCFKIARNKLADWHRKRCGSSYVGTTGGVPEVAYPSRDVSDPKLVQAVSKGLEALPDTDREILELRHFQPADSFAEIGRMLGISEGTARARCHRATKRLAGVLQSTQVVQEWLAKAAEPENRP